MIKTKIFKGIDLKKLNRKELVILLQSLNLYLIDSFEDTKINDEIDKYVDLISFHIQEIDDVLLFDEELDT